MRSYTWQPPTQRPAWAQRVPSDSSMGLTLTYLDLFPCHTVFEKVSVKTRPPASCRPKLALPVAPPSEQPFLSQPLVI